MDDNFGYEEQELVAVIPSQQNWKGIGISLVVILSVIGLVALSVWIMTPPDTGPRIKGVRMELSNLTSGMFNTNNYNCTWYSDTELAFINPGGNLMYMNTQTGDTHLIVSANMFKTLNSFSYSLSPDRVWVMVKHQPTTSYLGNTAYYSIQNTKTGLNSPVIKVGVESLSTWDSQERLSHVEWAGESGGVIIVKDNDLYFKPTPGVGDVVRITNTGLPGLIYNGVPDWTYRERILRPVAGAPAESAVWVSRDHSAVLYISINSSAVTEVRYPRLLGTHESSLDDVFIKYPMAGSKIPEVKLYLFTLKDKKQLEINPPQLLENKDFYIENVNWVDSETWTVTWLAREQEIRILSFCKLSGSCTQELFEHASNYGYNSLPINHHQPLINRELNKIAYIGLKLEGELGLYPHIHIKPLGGTESPKIVTHGAWRVKELVKWDKHYIYFLGTAGDSEGTQHLYRYKLGTDSIVEREEREVEGDTKNNTLLEHTVQGVACISCVTDCKNTRADLSSSAKMYIQQCVGPSIPYTQVCLTYSGECFLQLDNNSELKDTLEQFSLSKTKHITVETSPGRIVNVELKLPAGFREYEEFTFPLVLHIDSLYPGLSNEWAVTWIDYLASHKDYVIAKIESSGMERLNESSVGEGAQKDILQVLRYLSQELHFVDKTKIAVVGEDEGGYMAGKVYSGDLDSVEDTLTKCIVFISPTVSWKLADAFRSENLLGTSKKAANWNRYELSCLTSHTLGYSGQSLYLTNRPGDLVNLHQLFQLSRKLVLEGTVFKQQVYIDDGQDVNSWMHFYKSMEAHLETCLGPVEDFYRDDYFLASISML